MRRTRAHLVVLGLLVMLVGMVAAPAQAARRFKEFQVPTPASAPLGIAAGPDGAMWFVEFYGHKVGRITRSGVLAEYPTPTRATCGSPRAWATTSE
jgi:streptogramin lyase